MSSSTRYKSISWQRNKSDSCGTIDAGNLSPKGNHNSRHGNHNKYQMFLIVLFLVNLSSSMDSTMMTKRVSQTTRGKAATTPDPSRTGKKKPVKKNWTQAQSGGCGSWRGRG